MSRLQAVLLVLVAAVAMSPGMTGDFLRWDDDRFVTDNPSLQRLSWENVKGAFSGPQQQAYHPLHTISYMIDSCCWQDWPTGYKLHSFVLYALGLLLLGKLAIELGFTPRAATLGALVFAVHPLHVEAVVWISARKETLSFCFFLGAALLYLRTRGALRDWRWWATLACFSAALLSKTSTVVLPALLFVVDLVMRGRRPRQSLVALSPMLVAALASSIYVVWLWQGSHMIGATPDGAAAKGMTILRSYGHYVLSSLFPVNLSPVYPIKPAAFDGVTLAGTIAIAVIATTFIRSRNPRLRLILAWFVVALLPVANIVPVYFFVQDRYAFLASAAMVFAVAAIVDSGWGAGRSISLACVLIVVILAVASARQATHWRSDLSLWSHAARVQPDSYYAHLALGHTLRRDHSYGAALAEYKRAIELDPSAAAARLASCVTQVERASADPDAVEATLKKSWNQREMLLWFSGASARRYPNCAAVAEWRAFRLADPSPAERILAASRWTSAGYADGALEQLAALHPIRAGLPKGLQASYFEVLAQAYQLAKRYAEARAAMAASLFIEPRTHDRLESAARRLRSIGRHELAELYARYLPGGKSL